MANRSFRLILPLALGALITVGAGCAGKTEVAVDEAAVNANASVTTQPAAEKKPRQLEVDLAAIGSAGLSGKAVLIEENEKTKVMVKLSGDGSASKRPAHIHLGVCPAPGEVLYPLADVVGGRSATLIDVRFDDILASGAMAINVHKSGSEIGVYLSCGDLLLSRVMEKNPGVEAMMQAEPETKGDGGETKKDGGETKEDTKVNVNDDAKLDLNVGDVVATKVVKITADKFTFTPAEVRVKLGEKVRLEIASIDVNHGIALPAFNVNSALKAGTTTKVEFTADKKGSFPFFCNVLCGNGHRSMTGTLIVE